MRELKADCIRLGRKEDRSGQYIHLHMCINVYILYNVSIYTYRRGLVWSEDISGWGRWIPLDGSIWSFRICPISTRCLAGFELELAKQRHHHYQVSEEEAVTLRRAQGRKVLWKNQDRRKLKEMLKRGWREVGECDASKSRASTLGSVMRGLGL